MTKTITITHKDDSTIIQVQNGGNPAAFCLSVEERRWFDQALDALMHRFNAERAVLTVEERAEINRVEAAYRQSQVIEIASPPPTLPQDSPKGETPIQKAGSKRR